MDNNFESFDFKPVTEGLGFNQAKKIEVKEKLKAASHRAQERAKTKPIFNSQTIQSQLVKPVERIRTRSQAISPEKLELDENFLNSAVHLYQKVFAWLIDCSLIITFSLLGTFCVHFFVTKSLETSEILLIFSALSSAEKLKLLEMPVRILSPSKT